MADRGRRREVVGVDAVLTHDARDPRTRARARGTGRPPPRSRRTLASARARDRALEREQARAFAPVDADNGHGRDLRVLRHFAESTSTKSTTMRRSGTSRHVLRHRRREHDAPSIRCSRTTVVRPMRAATRSGSTERQRFAGPEPDEAAQRARARARCSTTFNDAQYSSQRVDVSRSAGSSTNVPRWTRYRAARILEQMERPHLVALVGRNGIRCTR